VEKTTDVEELRSRIANEIGRDKILITSADTQRHFDPASFVAFYAGGLFLAFVSAAGKRLWEKIQQQGEKAGEHAVNAVWDTVAMKLIGASHDAENDSDEKQIERIKGANSGLRQIGAEVEKRYLEDFLDAGQIAVESRLRRDHFPEAKAKRIAAAIALEVKERIAGGRT
jgi:hypothetical protein